jgi:hypothetical protein
MTEDLPQDEEGEMGLAWAVVWGTENGEEPPAAEATGAQETMAMLVEALKHAAESSKEPDPEPSRILIPH